MTNDYETKLKRLSYLVQLLTFFLTTKENEKLQTQLKNKIAELASEEVVGVTELKIL